MSEICGHVDSEVGDSEEDVDLFDLDLQYLEDVENSSGQKPHRRSAGDHPLKKWVPEINNYLTEMLHLEGCCGFDSGRCRFAHLLSTQSKMSGYEFYQSLARLTDNTSVHTPKDHYPAFMRIMRMWRHLKMLKRAGWGHEPGGVQATQPGSCAILCLVCPHPGKNLPPDWEKTPEDQRWIYRLFIRLDANFHLKRKKVSSDSIDPGLNHGYAYFVEEKAYKEYLSTYDSLVKEEQSTCNNHDVVKLPNIRGSVAGTAASGIGAVTCTHHDMRLPCSVGDLQKGEQ
ncbi:hypothetical protein SCP_0112540 [Sparassis crispa]|uniref:CxC2-like cysteine cluster KDZ transposase-associated domain-containing protein n=1 Tax=Sparassis crispa TaxID=139825 RepID=A0A401G894_9APHY|nr:hypothetical protein SCP_0112540 [Sparassis crispa]GBE78369.1 hypothetical protein SCP_0112540 [Sparassis crispa]